MWWGGWGGGGDGVGWGGGVGWDGGDVVRWCGGEVVGWGWCGGVGVMWWGWCGGVMWWVGGDVVGWGWCGGVMWWGDVVGVGRGMVYLCAQWVVVCCTDDVLQESAKWQERRESLDVCLKLVTAPKLEQGDYHDLMKAIKKVRVMELNGIVNRGALK